MKKTKIYLHSQTYEIEMEEEFYEYIKDDIEKKVYWTNRSIAVVSELIASLDKSQGDIALYLN